MLDQSRRFTCLCCLVPAAVVKLDKKGRPFVACTSCGTMIFSRGGIAGTHAAVETLRLLESPGATDYVRATAYSAAAQGDSALTALLRPVAASPVATPAAAAPDLQLRAAANG